MISSLMYLQKLQSGNGSARSRSRPLPLWRFRRCPFRKRRLFLPRCLLPLPTLKPPPPRRRGLVAMGNFNVCGKKLSSMAPIWCRNRRSSLVGRCGPGEVPLARPLLLLSQHRLPGGLRGRNVGFPRSQLLLSLRKPEQLQSRWPHERLAVRLLRSRPPLLWSLLRQRRRGSAEHPLANLPWPLKSPHSRLRRGCEAALRNLRPGARPVAGRSKHQLRRASHRPPLAPPAVRVPLAAPNPRSQLPSRRHRPSLRQPARAAVVLRASRLSPQ